jgi:hypothetical protein
LVVALPAQRNNTGNGTATPYQIEHYGEQIITWFKKGLTEFDPQITQIFTD